MENLVVIFKTICAVFFMLLSSFAIWSFYDNYLKHNNSNIDYSLEKPTKQELQDLLNQVTKGLPEPYREPFIEKRILIFMSKYYDNPSQEMIDHIEKNISAQNYWVEVETDDKNSREYCYDQIKLYTYKEFYPKANIETFLDVGVEWSEYNGCIRLYKQKAIPVS